VARTTQVVTPNILGVLDAALLGLVMGVGLLGHAMAGVAVVVGRGCRDGTHSVVSEVHAHIVLNAPHPCKHIPGLLCKVCVHCT